MRGESGVPDQLCVGAWNLGDVLCTSFWNHHQVLHGSGPCSSPFPSTHPQLPSSNQRLLSVHGLGIWTMPLDICAQ